MKRSMLLFALAPMLLLAACKEEPYPLKAEEATMAELGARDIADRSQATFLGCSGQDSPPVDGYVTCTIKGVQPPHTESELVCSYKSRGCKRK